MDHDERYDQPSVPRLEVTVNEAYKQNMSVLEQMRGEREELLMGIDRRQMRVRELEILIEAHERCVERLAAEMPAQSMPDPHPMGRL